MRVLEWKEKVNEKKSERGTRWQQRGQQRGYEAMQWGNSEEGRPCPLVKLSASTWLPDKCGCCVVANGQGNVSEERRGQSDLNRPPLSGAFEGRLCPAQLWWPFLRRIFSHEQGTVLPAATQEGWTPINSLAIHYSGDLKVPAGHSSGVSYVTLLEFHCNAGLKDQENFYPTTGN